GIEESNRIHIDADRTLGRRGDVPTRLPAVTEVQCRAAVGMTGNDPERHANCPPAIRYVDKNSPTRVDQSISFSLAVSEVVGRFRTDEQSVVPCDFRLRLRQLLQPGAVG